MNRADGPFGICSLECFRTYSVKNPTRFQYQESCGKSLVRGPPPVTSFAESSLTPGAAGSPTFATAIAASRASTANEPLLVQINSGKVRGIALGGVISWKGIPHAALPVGSRCDTKTFYRRYTHGRHIGTLH